MHEGSKHLRLLSSMTSNRIDDRRLHVTWKQVPPQPSRMTLRMEPAHFVERMVHSYQNTQRHIPNIVILTVADARA